MTILLALLMQAGVLAGQSERLAAVEVLSDGTERSIDCGEAHVQRDLNMCSDMMFVEADDALNAQWDIAAAKMRSMDKERYASEDGRPGYFDALLESQGAWLTYRDAHCVNEGYLARGGTMEPMLRNFCLAELTRERTEQLRQLAEYPE